MRDRDFLSVQKLHHPRHQLPQRKHFYKQGEADVSTLNLNSIEGAFRHIPCEDAREMYSVVAEWG